MTETLHNRDDSQNDDDGEPNHVTVTHLVTIANGKITKTTGSDCAGNGGDPDKAHKSDEGDASDARDAFS